MYRRKLFTLTSCLSYVTERCLTSSAVQLYAGPSLSLPVIGRFSQAFCESRYDTELNNSPNRPVTATTVAER